MYILWNTFFYCKCYVTQITLNRVWINKKRLKVFLCCYKYCKQWTINSPSEHLATYPLETRKIKKRSQHIRWRENRKLYKGGFLEWRIKKGSHYFLTWTLPLFHLTMLTSILRDVKFRSISSLTIPQSKSPGGLLKHRLLLPHRVSAVVGLRWAIWFVLLASPQMILVLQVQGLHFENHRSAETFNFSELQFSPLENNN